MMIFDYIRKKSILCMLVIAFAFILCGNTKNTSAQRVFNDEAGFIILKMWQMEHITLQLTMEQICR